MSVLICDADGELWFTRQEELGLDYISMPYSIDGNIYYYDLGKNTDLKKFYDDMRKGAAPTTMALNPQEYVDILEKYFENSSILAAANLMQSADFRNASAVAILPPRSAL